MDINDMRSIVTVLAFVTFIGIVWWAYSRHSRQRFDEAAQLPFADEFEAGSLSPAPLLQGEKGGDGRGQQARPRKDEE